MQKNASKAPQNLTLHLFSLNHLLRQGTEIDRAIKNLEEREAKFTIFSEIRPITGFISNFLNRLDLDPDQRTVEIQNVLGKYAGKPKIKVKYCDNGVYNFLGTLFSDLGFHNTRYLFHTRRSRVMLNTAIKASLADHNTHAFMVMGAVHSVQIKELVENTGEYTRISINETNDMVSMLFNAIRLNPAESSRLAEKYREMVRTNKSDRQ